MKQIMNKKILIILLALMLILTALVGCIKEVSNVVEEVAPKGMMPTLPDMDYEGLDFFDDGYEIVELVGTIDGDTAKFAHKYTVFSYRHPRDK